MTDNPLFYVTLFACLAVLAVLLVGVGGFARGGEFNRKYANKIMRLRLLLQFIAVILIVATVYFAGRG
ncbi:twin transmembrane helix small protein [Rhodobacteraceae bacterium 2CG4]|uniref:Twin transmembrane helix small protein n=1 Tax=Halovulum marinum TaxID=2662447 RepID=A0A6L5YV07_9RHOB|nr:twin transmembrane helix small protein [Halovulum marinum]MSU88118.1 twin transmembrane helix small protein [Halovulum marinum]